MAAKRNKRVRQIQAFLLNDLRPIQVEQNRKKSRKHPIKINRSGNYHFTDFYNKRNSMSNTTATKND